MLEKGVNILSINPIGTESAVTAVQAANDKGVPILARTAGLIAHLLEEQVRPIGFVLSHAGAAAIDYDGTRPPDFEPSHE